MGTCSQPDGRSEPRVHEDVLLASESEIQRDHEDRPLDVGDLARVWRNPNLRGVELFRGSYRNYQFARHFHRVPAIGVVERGVMSSYCRRGNHILSTGTVLLFNPGEVHAPAPADSYGWSFRMFYLDADFFENAPWNLFKRNLKFTQPFVQDAELAKCLFSLHQDLESKGEKLSFDSHLMFIISRLAERYSERPISALELKPDKTAVDAARQYLEANCHRNPSLEDLAKISPYGASHFLRMFRDIVGLTPHVYLTQFRIEKAAVLMQSGMPLIEVANMLGFTDQSHFTKKFKRIYGVTPGQYATAFA